MANYLYPHSWGNFLHNHFIARMEGGGLYSGADYQHQDSLKETYFESKYLAIKVQILKLEYCSYRNITITFLMNFIKPILLKIRFQDHQIEIKLN